MKKRAYFIVLIGFIVLLCGCQQQPVAETMQQMDVVIHIKSDAVYSIGMEYCVDRKLLGGQECMGDPSMTRPLNEDEKISFTFTEMDFWAVEDCGSGIFGFAAEVASADGEYMPLGFLWEWNAQYGGEYHFTLTENAEGGFTLEPTESGAEYTKTPLGEVSFE